MSVCQRTPHHRSHVFEYLSPARSLSISSLLLLVNTAAVHGHSEVPSFAVAAAAAAFVAPTILLHLQHTCEFINLFLHDVASVIRLLKWRQ